MHSWNGRTLLIWISLCVCHGKHSTHIHTHAPHWHAHLKQGDGNSHARYKCNPLFIMYLRDVAQRKKCYIFRSVCGTTKMYNHKKPQNMLNPTHLQPERDTGIPFLKSERVLALQVPAQSITKSLSVCVYSRERNAQSILLAS